MPRVLGSEPAQLVGGSRVAVPGEAWSPVARNALRHSRQSLHRFVSTKRGEPHYRPSRRKNSRRGERRVIPIGSLARELLTGFPTREPTAHLAPAQILWSAAPPGERRPVGRTWPVTRGIVWRNRSGRPGRTALVERRGRGQVYIPSWAPNQLRYSHGLEARAVRVGGRKSCTRSRGEYDRDLCREERRAGRSGGR